MLLTSICSKCGKTGLSILAKNCTQCGHPLNKQFHFDQNFKPVPVEDRRCPYCFKLGLSSWADSCPNCGSPLSNEPVMCRSCLGSGKVYYSEMPGHEGCSVSKPLGMPAPRDAPIESRPSYEEMGKPWVGECPICLGEGQIGN